MIPATEQRWTWDDITGPNDGYEEVNLLVEHRNAKRAWYVRARRLSGIEHMRILDKHRKTTAIGRTEVTKTDHPAAMVEMILTMVDGPKCDPPITRQNAEKLPPDFVEAFVRHFGLMKDKQEEDRLGESAPS